MAVRYDSLVAILVECFFVLYKMGAKNGVKEDASSTFCVTYLLTTPLQRTLAKLRVIDFFLHDGFINFVTKLLKAVIS